jgi:hypothetical protein
MKRKVWELHLRKHINSGENLHVLTSVKNFVVIR